MAHCYKFAIVRLAPDDARDERLNIGAVILAEHGLDVRISRRLEKVRALSAAVDTSVLRELIENLKHLDERFRAAGIEVDARLKMISRIGPLSLSSAGTFVAEDINAYEDRVASLLKAMVDPEPAPFRAREKRSKLFTQVKALFRQERVLANKGEALDSHRIVPSYQLAEGLVADLVLRNGAMHVVETIDASGEEDSLNRAIGSIGVAALVLERARMEFGDKQTKARLVYNASASLEKIALPSLKAAEHQGAILTNWASADERARFVYALASLATPIERKRNRSFRPIEVPQTHKLKLWE
ncbi:MAG: DUF3037 domain-containing protein [Methylobacterium sp.]|nr:DUF3037 domain-containing protein [Rhodobacter sp.]MCA3659475.1 DUF3037 domain-containing protein [Methylobacterium sp.]MCA3673078.1 DUF3037 domain-containing protein [Methylobacterium sp.]MCA3674038.1 DUF3037 domain-containing protein [Methylobacterium sp.]MCA3678824.1 DUF3037 domain-containing protein [Methylobacterium sp.]